MYNFLEIFAVKTHVRSLRFINMQTVKCRLLIAERPVIVSINMLGTELIRHFICQKYIFSFNIKQLFVSILYLIIRDCIYFTEYFYSL